MRNITGWISMSIEEITGRRFFSIEKITGNFGSSLMNCSTSRQHTGKICSSKDKNSSLTSNKMEVTLLFAVIKLALA
jgi:hypothetical protein